jgi:hypothetical protein
MIRCTAGRTRICDGRRRAAGRLLPAVCTRSYRWARSSSDSCSAWANAVEDAFGSAGHVAALQADVVLGADPGQGGDFLTAQTGDAAAAAVHPQPRLFGGDARPPGGQELPDIGPDLLSVGHVIDRTRPIRGAGRPCQDPPGSTPDSRDSSWWAADYPVRESGNRLGGPCWYLPQQALLRQDQNVLTPQLWAHRLLTSERKHHVCHFGLTRPRTATAPWISGRPSRSSSGPDHP